MNDAVAEARRDVDMWLKRYPPVTKPWWLRHLEAHLSHVERPVNAEVERVAADLVERTVDWDGTLMVDGAEPRREADCGTLRLVAAMLRSLAAERDDLRNEVAQLVNITKLQHAQVERRSARWGRTVMGDRDVRLREMAEMEYADGLSLNGADIEEALDELTRLRARVAELEARVAALSAAIDNLSEGPFPEKHPGQSDFGRGLVEGYRQCVETMRAALSHRSQP